MNGLSLVIDAQRERDRHIRATLSAVADPVLDAIVEKLLLWNAEIEADCPTTENNQPDSGEQVSEKTGL